MKLVHTNNRVIQRFFLWYAHILAPANQVLEPSSTPVEQTKERIQVLDILRGIALFGVLLVNIRLFSRPDDMVWFGTINHIVESAVLFLADGKFYPIFSFLFGLGFVLLMMSTEKRNMDFGRFFRRRLFVLLCIGIIHALLFSHIDVLVQYALLGYLLLLFRKRSPRALLITALVFLVLPFLVRSVASFILGENPSFAQGSTESVIAIYAHGSYAEIFAQRIRDITYYYQTVLDHSLYKIFAMFLFGAWAGRLGIFQNISAYRRHLRLALWLSFFIGVIGNLGYILTQELHIVFTFPIEEIALNAFFALSDLALACFYIALFSVLGQHSFWQRILAPLSYVGRMSLTNYLMQSVICTTIFYSYGLGLYGSVSPTYDLMLTFAIYAVQIVFSMIWLQRFKFGPAEKVWRALTYWRLEPDSRTV